MATRTISFTRIKPNPFGEVLKAPYNDELCSIDRLNKRAKYFREESALDEFFERRLDQLNSRILEGIDKFVSKSLDTKNESLFAGRLSERMYGAVLRLDMQTTDHEATFLSIEKHLRKNHKINIVRISNCIKRKRNLLELLDSLRQTKYLFVIIEQTETFNLTLTDFLVGHLRNRLVNEEDPADAILILFCLSTRLQELPLDSMSFFGKISYIERDKEFDNANTRDEMLKLTQSSVKLGPDPLNMIYECHLNCDTSMTNLKLMCKYCFFNFYSLKPSINETATKEFHKKNGSLSKALDYHDFICDQINCYFNLLQDAGRFPGDPLEIYEELFEHIDLSCSTQVYEAVKALGKFPQHSILKRIEITEAQRKDVNNDAFVVSVLSKYKDKIANNEDLSQVVFDMVHELLAHCRTLKNPKIRHPEIYLNDWKSVESRILPASRGNYYNHLQNPQTYFGCLYSMITKCPWKMSLMDIYCDISTNLIDLIHSDRATSPTRSLNGIKTKQTPKKRKVDTPKSSKSKTNGKFSEQESEGLAKAILMDLIDSMQMQMLIRCEKKGPRGLTMVRRCVWEQ